MKVLNAPPQVNECLQTTTCAIFQKCIECFITLWEERELLINFERHSALYCLSFLRSSNLLCASGSSNSGVDTGEEYSIHQVPCQQQSGRHWRPQPLTPLSFFGVSGAGQGTTAPWFRPERLRDPDFSVDAYVSELRQYAPLEALSSELEKYLASMKSKVGVRIKISGIQPTSGCMKDRQWQSSLIGPYISLSLPLQVLFYARK